LGLIWPLRGGLAPKGQGTRVGAGSPWQQLGLSSFDVVFSQPRSMHNKGCVTLWLAICIKKYLKAKEDLWKLEYFTMQTYNLQKSSKRNQNPSRYYNSI